VDWKCGEAFPRRGGVAPWENKRESRAFPTWIGALLGVDPGVLARAFVLGRAHGVGRAVDNGFAKPFF